MLLEELDLSYGEIIVDRSRGGQRDPAFLALNPQGLLPVLIDPDQAEPLFETAAILLHLTRPARAALFVDRPVPRAIS